MWPAGDDDEDEERWVQRALTALHEEITQMATDFTQSQGDLDAAIAKVGADVKALLTAVASIPGAQAQVAAEVSALQASTSALTAIDTEANPAPPPPPA